MSDVTIVPWEKFSIKNVESSLFSSIRRSNVTIAWEIKRLCRCSTVSSLTILRQKLK